MARPVVADAPAPAAVSIEILEEQTADSPRARRNLLLGLWAAERLGLSGQDAAAYAGSVMAADHARPGDADVLAKLAGDLAAAGLPPDAGALRAELAAAQRSTWAQTLPHHH